MPANALRVKERKFSTFQANTNGQSVQIQGEYEITLVNNGLLRVPSVSASVSELSISNGAVSIIENAKTKSIGSMGRGQTSKAKFEFTVSGSSQELRQLSGTACQGDVSTLTTDETYSGLLLASGSTGQVEVKSPSPSCDNSEKLPEQPEPQPPEPQPPEPQPPQQPPQDPEPPQQPPEEPEPPEQPPEEPEPAPPQGESYELPDFNKDGEINQDDAVDASFNDELSFSDAREYRSAIGIDEDGDGVLTPEEKELVNIDALERVRQASNFYKLPDYNGDGEVNEDDAVDAGFNDNLTFEDATTYSNAIEADAQDDDDGVLTPQQREQFDIDALERVKQESQNQNAQSFVPKSMDKVADDKF
jgi:outer membrane biosynthesis protein TonB